MEMVDNSETSFQLKHNPHSERSRNLLEHSKCNQGGGKKFGPSNGWHVNIIILNIIQIKKKLWGCFFDFFFSLGAYCSESILSLAVLLLSACI